MKLEETFLVIKYADIETLLNDEEQAHLAVLARTIRFARAKQGKQEHTYVVINQDEPYFQDVLALMEQDHSRKGKPLFAEYTDRHTGIYLSVEYDIPGQPEYPKLSFTFPTTRHTLSIEEINGAMSRLQRMAGIVPPRTPLIYSTAIPQPNEGSTQNAPSLGQDTEEKKAEHDDILS